MNLPSIKHRYVMHQCLLLFVGMIFLLSVQDEFATIQIVDQQNSVENGSISWGGSSGIGFGIGQSFTPSLTSMDATDFTMLTLGGSATLRLDVFAGSGFGGTLLGSSAPLTLTNTTYQTIEFDLLSPVTLTAGNAYTLGVTMTAGSGNVNAEFASTNPYPDGIVFFSDGETRPEFDLVFTEGSVPEPSTWAAGFLAAVTILCSAWRQRAGWMDCRAYSS